VPTGAPPAAAGRAGRAGRKRVPSHADLEHAAFDLFQRNGFERTTIDDIACAAGIGRRTFFRYFPSKNDVPWGRFEEELERMRVRLSSFPPHLPLMEAIRAAIVDFNRVPADQIPWHRRRMELILRTPALQAHSTLRYASWRQVIAEFVGERIGQPPDALAPRAIAHAALGVAVAAYEQWLETDGADLAALLNTAMRQLEAAFGNDLGPAEAVIAEATGHDHQELAGGAKLVAPSARKARAEKDAQPRRAHG
jgi:mycofactocin system transcriptional regulator